MKMFEPILKLVGSFFSWIDSWAGNYILVLLIIAVLFELLLLPFGIKQQKNSIKQARLRPKEMAIRKKYAGRNDKATQQKQMLEVQDLYKSEGYNQFAGCLPLLLQLPIIMGIYSVVVRPLEYVVQLSADTITKIGELLEIDSTAGSIKLLTVIQEKGLDFFRTNGLDAAAYEELAGKFDLLPNFNFLGINMGEIPTLEWNLLLIIPILTFAVYFASMKITRKFTYQAVVQDEQAGCSNNVMDFMMPLFSLFIAFSVPAAVGIYWIYKSILGTVKQIILYKVMPVPVCTEEDIKAAERELRGKAPIAEREFTVKPTKSLHHEDDDDDEPYPTFVGAKSRYDEDTPEQKKNPKDETLLGDAMEEAPLNEDDRD